MALTDGAIASCILPIYTVLRKGTGVMWYWRGDIFSDSEPKWAEVDVKRVRTKRRRRFREETCRSIIVYGNAGWSKALTRLLHGIRHLENIRSHVQERRYR